MLYDGILFLFVGHFVHRAVMKSDALWCEVLRTVLIAHLLF